MKSIRYSLLWGYVKIILDSQLPFIWIILLWGRHKPLVIDKKSSIDEVRVFSCLVPQTVQGKHDLGMNMSAVVKPVNVPAWPKVSFSCGITLGGKVIAVGLASHQMLLCALKPTIHGLRWSAVAWSLSVIPDIINVSYQFLSPESRTYWEQSLWLKCCTGTDLFSFPSRLCTSVSSCVSRDVILVAWKQLQERGVWREREEGSTLWNLANQDLCKCCRGRLSLCPPLSAESWFLNSYWHTTWLCPFYFVTLTAKHCIIDVEGAW